MNELEKFTSIGLGTWNMERNEAASIRALRAGLDEGSNHIDTAEMYGSGRCEELVAKALGGDRTKVFIVSKVLPSNAEYASTIKACERSLKRLQTDYLDIYLLHWRGRTPLEETFRAFEKLKSDGKIKSWGVSNFDESDLEEARQLVGEPSVSDGRLVCNQVYYSIEERAAEDKVLPWCQKHNVRLVAYSPLGQGKMPEDDSLRKVAHETGSTAAQVALAFLLDKGAIAIPKSSDEQRTRENVSAMKLKLTAQQRKTLEDAFPLKRRRSLPTV